MICKWRLLLHFTSNTIINICFSKCNPLHFVTILNGVVYTVKEKLVQAFLTGWYSNLTETIGAHTNTHSPTDSWSILRLQIKGLSTQKGALLLHYRLQSIIRELSELQISITTINIHVIKWFLISGQSLQPLKYDSTIAIKYILLTKWGRLVPSS